ncbi:MAG: NAD(P)(+) transhydrogenase (Re/Si-specific) subunit beta [Gemmatimonadetes bacterium]|nr:MAG: NAD(P)(+) transhydrogenase (Re/Si-specific) subunit beta [Gemmatimonadota bacterium]
MNSVQFIQNLELPINLVYIVAALLFVFGLKMLSSATTARKGNMISALGMALAVVVTLFDKDILINAHTGELIFSGYKWIALGAIIGGLIGLIAAKTVKMTAMPEMVGLFNGSGGLASLLLAWAEFQRSLYNTEVFQAAPLGGFEASVIAIAVLIGGVTFSGSVIAWGKLSETMPSQAIVFPGQNIVNAILLIAAVVGGVMFAMNPVAGAYGIFIAIVIISLILGILAVISIGGGDMPVVISLLNSYSGLAACAAGFVILNNVLIVAGALVGASGLILTNIMCKAMNRSLANVLFSGFGATTAGAGKQVEGEVKPISPEDTYLLLEAASSVAFVPGYGLAVAQAQHVVRELGDLLEKNGAEVYYAIHPVAGRMPGHMNVLLAEANVPYEQLVEMDDINPKIENIDVCMVIGANDVVNPAAREDETSPLWGMPIIDVDKARTTIVLKRSMRTGFAGVQNPLFFKPNTRMLFGDAKESISALVAEFKD